MKKFVVIALTMVLLGCAGTPTRLTVTDVEGVEWRLIEVHIEDTFGWELLFDRAALVDEGFGNLFTLTFDGEIVSGVASPNLFSAPYTFGEDQAVSIMPMRSTLMASLFEPEKLPEHQFFNYMHSVYEWELTDSTLILRSRTDDGREVQLLFWAFR